MCLSSNSSIFCPPPPWTKAYCIFTPEIARNYLVNIFQFISITFARYLNIPKYSNLSRNVNFTGLLLDLARQLGQYVYCVCTDKLQWKLTFLSHSRLDSFSCLLRQVAFLICTNILRKFIYSTYSWHYSWNFPLKQYSYT